MCLLSSGVTSHYCNWGSRKQSDRSRTLTLLPSAGGAVSHNSFCILSKFLLQTSQKLPNFQHAPEGLGELGAVSVDRQSGEQSNLPQNLRSET